MKRLTVLAVATLAQVTACGSPPPPAPVKKNVETQAPRRAKTGEADFTVSKGAKPFGREHLATYDEEGGATIVELSATHEMAGNKLESKGEIRFDKSLLPAGSAIDIDVAGKKTRALLERTSAGLVVKASQDGADESLKETKPSTLYLPSPFVAGYVSVCARASLPEAFVEFPGSEAKVIARRELPEGRVRVVVLDRGGLRRTEILCRDKSLLGVREPLEGFVAIRKGEEKTLEALKTLFERRKPSLSATLVEEQVSVAVPKKDSDDEAKLACSLVLPKAPTTKGPLPAVVFITGSGPQDRDEDSVGEGLHFSLFKHLAIRLGEADIASLRCDDRGTGESTGDFKRATLYTFARDARAALELLRADKRIDKKRTAIVGHSEGGLVGPLVASKDALLKALVLLAGPARPLDEIGMKQAEDALAAAGLEPSVVKKKLDEQRAVIDAIKKGGPLPERLTETEKAVIELQRPWLKSHFENSPEKTLRALSDIPIFVGQGESDRQVPKEDADHIAKILLDSKKKKVELHVYPGLSHLFMPTKTGSLADYSDPEAVIDEAFLRDVVSFAKKSL